MESLPRVLPWQECPSAAASGSRLVASTCSHLNDALRSLEDVAALLDLPPAEG